MGYRLNRLDEPVFIAVSKPLLTEFAIHHNLRVVGLIINQNMNGKKLLEYERGEFKGGKEGKGGKRGEFKSGITTPLNKYNAIFLTPLITHVNKKSIFIIGEIASIPSNLTDALRGVCYRKCYRKYDRRSFELVLKKPVPKAKIAK